MTQSEIDDMDWTDHGLRLLDLRRTAPGERAAFLEYVRLFEGPEYPRSVWDFWLSNRPDVLKAHRLALQHSNRFSELGVHGGAHVAVSMLHHYAILRNETGILHMIRHCIRGNVSRDQVLETLAVAFLHAGPSGLYAVVNVARDWIDAYPAVSEPAIFPTGWFADRTAFQSGLDFSLPELTREELELLTNWYENTLGEVPTSVRFLAKYHPGMLKAYRARWEVAVCDLPKQIMPYLMLQHNVNRGFKGGIREAALLARAFGMTRDQVLSAVVNGMTYHGGMDSLYIAAEAIDDLLDAWPAPDRTSSTL
jgi:hypothetical protein